MKKSIGYVAVMALMVAGAACASSDGGSQDPAAAAAGEAATVGDRTLPAQIDHQRIRLMKAASPAAWSRADALSPKLAHALSAENAPSPMSAAIDLVHGSYRADGTSVSDGDIEAMCFIVLMQATNDMDKDLKELMAEVKAMTAAKAKLRELIAKVNKDIAANAGQRDGAAPIAVDTPGGCFGDFANCLLFTPPSDSHALLARAIWTRATASMANGKPATLAELQSIFDALTGQLDTLSEMSEMTSLRLQMAMDRRSKFVATLSNVMKKISTTQDGIVANLK